MQSQKIRIQQHSPLDATFIASLSKARTPRKPVCGVSRGCDRRTTAGKAEFAAFQAEAVSREIITQDDGVKLAWRMVQAIREKPGLCKLLDPARGRPEVTVRVQMKFFQLQARIDWYIEKPEGGGPPMCVNLKTIERLADFDSHFWKYGYYRGDAFYRAVLAKALALETGSEPQMVDLAVEKAEPYQAELRVPDAQSLTIGWQEVEHDLMTLRNCFETNTWPGAKDEPRPVSLPSWKTKEAP